MKIYTKAGDLGQTGLYGGERVPKDHLRIQSYGTLDELNACLGLVISELDKPLYESLKSQRSGLIELQSELFVLGAELATPATKKMTLTPVSEQEIVRFENQIDQMEAELTPLKNFILPGGCAAASVMHIARTISRRAERELVALARSEELRPAVLQYVNRLSDYLFVMARFINLKANVTDRPWEK